MTPFCGTGPGSGILVAEESRLFDRFAEWHRLDPVYSHYVLGKLIVILIMKHIGGFDGHFAKQFSLPITIV